MECFNTKCEGYNPDYVNGCGDDSVVEEEKCENFLGSKPQTAMPSSAAAGSATRSAMFLGADAGSAMSDIAVYADSFRYEFRPLFIKILIKKLQAEYPE